MFLFTPSYLFFWINLILFRKQDKWFSISTKMYPDLRMLRLNTTKKPIFHIRQFKYNTTVLITLDRRE